ncbi:MAG TPA: proline dehydrogenase family protein [Gemmatimonadaceae bacterium]|nr:proline dehydrogenase family protein [Gemmatimonadaceae bacterium]
MAMSIMRRVLLAGSHSPWLERQVRSRAITRQAVRRFMPGEELSDALDAGSALAQRGMGVVLTQLGEHTDSPTQADAVRDHYQSVLRDIAARGLPAAISVKLTQLGLVLGDPTSDDACVERVLALARPAPARGERVWIDMEESPLTERTLRVYERVHAAGGRVGLCLQAYLRRTAADLERLRPLRPAVRLVKGAYREPPDVAFPAKRDVDANYRTLGMRLIEMAARGEAEPPVFGTHDVALARALLAHASAQGLAPTACEIHMLYGIRGAEQARLAAEGVRVRVLVSYGRAWFAWYMRRLAERPANVWFAIRGVAGG